MLSELTGCFEGSCLFHVMRRCHRHASLESQHIAGNQVEARRQPWYIAEPPVSWAFGCNLVAARAATWKTGTCGREEFWNSHHPMALGSESRSKRPVPVGLVHSRNVSDRRAQNLWRVSSPSYLGQIDISMGPFHSPRHIVGMGSHGLIATKISVCPAPDSLLKSPLYKKEKLLGAPYKRTRLHLHLLITQVEINLIYRQHGISLSQILMWSTTDQVAQDLGRSQRLHKN